MRKRWSFLAMLLVAAAVATGTLSLPASAEMAKESTTEKVKNNPGALATIGGLLGAAGSFAKLGR